MSTEKMREEFEAAYVEEMVRQHGEFFRSSAEYSIKLNSPMVEIGLWAWKASREALVIDLPELNPQMFSCNVVFGHEKARNEAIKAIEAAGLKVKP